jgi:hypothetical protein
VGGLLGSAANDTYISQCSFAGDVSGKRFVGGLVGAEADANISQCYSAGTVTVSSKGLAGGLIGSQSGVVKNCYSEATVINDWRSVGLIGVSWSDMVRMIPFLSSKNSVTLDI